MTIAELASALDASHDNSLLQALKAKLVRTYFVLLVITEGKCES